MKQEWPTQSQETLIDWTAVYLSPFKCTKVTKLIIFQFKLLHRRLATNAFLKKIGIKEIDLCTFCKPEEENLIHLFWYCRVTSQFWQGFRQWMIINHEFVENEFTPEMVYGLEIFSFQQEVFLSCSYGQIFYLDMQNTGNASWNGKFQIFCINLCFFASF